MNGEYSLAVHALVYLNHKQKTLSSDELAENICTSPARVRKILAALKRAGLVSAKEGAEGGYRITGRAEEITLKAVAQAVDVCFVSASWRSGSVDMKCLVSSGMANIMDGIYSELDRACLERLDEITIYDVDQKIFNKR